MTSYQIEIDKLPERFYEMLGLAFSGVEVILTHDGVARTKLTPLSTLQPGQPRNLGLHPGSMVMSDDFDDPLPDEFWFGKS